MLCYPIELPGRNSVLRAGCRQDYQRKNLKIGPPAGRRPAGEPIWRLSRLESGRNPAPKARVAARKHYRVTQGNHVPETVFDVSPGGSRPPGPQSTTRADGFERRLPDR